MVTEVRCEIPRVVEAPTDEDPTPGLEARRPDFRPVEHLFRGEFEILCRLAYDEFATLRGCRGNLPLYDPLGALGGFARRKGARAGRPSFSTTTIPSTAAISSTTWSVLFGDAAALVTDGGAAMSHAAIIAREHGIAAVLSTGNGTQHLRDGERVIVDGNAGTVRRVAGD